MHTHPDPAEIAKIYGAEVAVACDTAALLRELREQLLQRPFPERDPEYLTSARAENARSLPAAVSTTQKEGGGATVTEVMAELTEVLDSESIVTGDATTSGKALIHALESTDATIVTTSSGSLGWGVGAAMGAKLASPRAHVVAVCGDGAFQFGLQGIWTAVRANSSVTFLVVNNAAYAAVGAAIRRYRGELSDAERSMVVDLSGPDLAEIARGFGVRGIRVAVPEVGEALREARRADSPTVIEVLTDPHDLGP